MRLSKPAPLLSVLLLAAAAPLRAGDLTVDLAQQKAGDVLTVPADAGRHRVRVVNARPGAQYEVTVVREIRSIDALTAPSGVATVAHSAPCSELDQRTAALLAATTEAAVPKLMADVKASLLLCHDPVLQQEANLALAKTVIDLGEYELPPGAQITVTAVRDEGGKKLTWVKAFQTEERGRWLTLYGLSAVRNHDDRFFLTPNDDKTFTIGAEESRKGYKAIPSVYFLWLPRKFQARDWSHGFTAGLGVKADEPALFAGYSLLYNWNVGLVAGASLSRELRLNGRYASGQVVKETIADDALHTKVLQTRWTVALIFRFGTNPFAAAPDSGGAKEPVKTKKGDEEKK